MISNIHIEDIDSFREAKDIEIDSVLKYLKGTYLDISEEEVQTGIELIIGERFHKVDWGGEVNDLYTSRVVVKGQRVPTAFLLKGNGLKARTMEIKDCGANGDQILRLCQSPARLFIVQFVGEVSERVIMHVEHEVDLLRYKEKKEFYYCIINGQDTARLLKAYGLLPTYGHSNHEVCEFMKRFNGQELPGGLFGVDEVVTLPKFADRKASVKENVAMTAGIDMNEMSFTIDVWANADDSSGERWIVQTELFPPSDEILYRLSHFGDLLSAEPWLIVFDKVPPQMREAAKKLDVMITGMDEWKKIKKAL